MVLDSLDLNLVRVMLTEDYTDLQTKTNEVIQLMSEITSMQASIIDLKNAQEQANTDQNLPLPESIALLNSHKANRDHLAISLERQSQENARKKREVEKLRTQLKELEQNRIDAEMFAREAEKSRNSENKQEDMVCRKQVGWWLKAMTALEMEFLGLKEFKFDERNGEVSLVMNVENVGDVPVLIYLKNRKFMSAKVSCCCDKLLILGCIQGSVED